VTLGGAAGADTAEVSEIAPNDGTTYNVAVSGMTGWGTVIASIAAGVAHDAADNPNEASTSTDNTVTYEPSILGDVNRDGLADPTDAAIILSCDVGLDTSAYCPMNCGDVNGDGLVNSTDALIILSYDVGMDVPFLVGEPGCPSSVTPCPGCSLGSASVSRWFRPPQHGLLE
jgi:hypothetical protein